MAKRVLFITDDMQRWDTIGAWNGPAAQYAKTPAGACCTSLMGNPIPSVPS